MPDFSKKDVVKISLLGKEICFWLPDHDDHIQKIIRRDEAFYEPDLLFHSMLELSAGDLVVDVGANIGNHSLFWAVVCGCRVLAIEPNPRAYCILEKNVELNRVGHLVTLIRSAAGARHSNAQLVEGAQGNLGAFSVCPVRDGEIKIEKTDKLIADAGFPVKLLKVDVEGFDCEVLLGAGATIDRDRPLIYCEAQTTAQRARIELLLRRFGYLRLRQFNFTPTYFFRDSGQGDLADIVLSSSDGLLETTAQNFKASFREIYRELSKSHSEINDQLVRLLEQQSEHSDVASNYLSQLEVGLSKINKLNEKHGSQLEEEVRIGLTVVDEIDRLKSQVVELKEDIRSHQASDIRIKRLKDAIDYKQSVLSRAIDALRKAEWNISERLEEVYREDKEELRRIECHLMADISDAQKESSRKLSEFNAQLVGLSGEINRMSEECHRLRESDRIHQMKIKRSELQKEKYREQVEVLYSTVSYQIGNAIVDLVRKPFRGWVRFPGRIVNAVFRRRKYPTQANKYLQQSTTRGRNIHCTQSSQAETQFSQDLTDERFRRVHRLFSDDSEKGFQDWSPNQDVQFEADGQIYIRQGFSTPGIKRSVRVKEESVYRLVLDVQWVLERGSLVVSVIDGERESPLCPVNGPEAWGPYTVYFQTLSDAQEVALNIVVKDPTIGDKVMVRSISFEEVEDLGLSVFRDDVHADPAIPIVASIASIPSRQQELRDCVYSLLKQVDELRVYLNNYSVTPDYLKGLNGVTVFHSDDYGDQGDAAKFFRASASKPEYLFTCDDDIVYPIDYVSRMLRSFRRLDENCIIGVHGVLLKQPFNHYYDKSNRFVFRHVGGLAQDTYVHVLGTGTTLMRTDRCEISSSTFQYPNMADIWLAKHAQERSIPLMAVSRQSFWLRQNDKLIANQRDGAEVSSIYEASISGRPGPLNTGLIQTSVLTEVSPISVPVRSKRQGIVKAIMSVTTLNRVEYLREFINTFYQTCDKTIQWVLIIADDGSTDGTLEYLEELKLPLEMHIIKNKRRYAVGQTNTIFELAKKIGFDVGFKSDDDVVFEKTGWDRRYIDAVEKTGFDHICYLNIEHFKELRTRESEQFKPTVEADKSGLLQSYCSVEQCMGAFFTFTERMLDEIGWADEENFPIRGQWHIDLSMRACRAGFNCEDVFYDVRGSNDFIKLQNNLRSDYKCSIDWNEEYQATKEIEEVRRRTAIIRDPSRIKVQSEKSDGYIQSDSGVVSVNDVVDRAFVLNLRRRPDRLALFNERAAAAGLSVQRFEAVDGSEQPFKDDWESYFSKPLATYPEGEWPIMGSKEYYLGEHCERSRLAFMETKLGRKAIQSVGAWGYLATMKRLLEYALEQGYENIAVFDDDAVFHKDFLAEFDRMYRKVPSGWRLLQLGTLQYHWGDEWIEWVNDSLYLGFGTGLASHAIIMNRSTFPLLLWHCEKCELPYDEGALHYAHKAYSGSCYTFYPNLVIQDVSESDINSSDVQEVEGSKAYNVYRWDLDNYLW